MGENWKDKNFAFKIFYKKARKEDLDFTCDTDEPLYWLTIMSGVIAGILTFISILVICTGAFEIIAQFLRK